MSTPSFTATREAPLPAGLSNGYLGMPTPGGSDFPEPLGCGGINMLVARRYGDSFLIQYSWVKAPVASGGNGYIHVLLDTLDPENLTHLEVEWLDVQRLELFPEP
jgi:hypothetical protein